MRLFKTNDYFKKCDTIMGWAAFLLAAVVYLMTIEPTTSLWDCAEFIATSYKLEVGHPPGAPLFMMIARFFTMFAPSPEKAAVMVNAMSALCSAFTILFLFWTITHMARRIYTRRGNALTTAQTWTIMGAGLIGAIAYTFSDTFWFSAVEGEVYAMSSLFTAAVVWMMLKWEEVADKPGANRWLILIAYMMGLSIGVHILNLLCIPAIVFIYYFKKADRITAWGVVKVTALAAVMILFVNNLVIPLTTSIGAWLDRIFVNNMGMPMHSGLITWIVLLLAAIIFGVWITHKKGKVVLNTIILCFGVIIVGYSSYASVVIRSAANPPMNSNDPKNAYGLLYLLNRDQYGNKPLLYGAQYPAPVSDVEYKNKYYVGDDGKYVEVPYFGGYKYPSEFMVFFPRMWNSGSAEGYKEWGQVKDKKTIPYTDPYSGERKRVAYPTAGENMRYFFSYQLNFMYWRYFMWNFVGRQSDVQSVGEITDGQWLSGIKPIDALYLGPQDDLPSEMENNRGRNKYFFLPFILGIIGLIYQLNRDPKNFTVTMWLFLMMGIALVMYFNTNPSEPRERDYVYAGSFYAFCIWVGLGVMAVRDWLVKLSKKEGAKWTAVAATALCASVPVLMGAQNWDDHDRSHRYVARDIGWNYLQSCLPNSIILNYGDNDTFPLWYNQEVEGVRPDVRIMNMSYLGGGWYVDQMKYRYNGSGPVPFSLPKDKYMYANDYIYVDDEIKEPVTVKQAINYIRSDDSRTRIRITEVMTVDYIPSKTLLLPVNKENAIASGIVRAEDAHLIQDTIVIDLKGTNTLDKPDMMLLDLLANFDWKRPLYFTQASALQTLGLQDYLQYDGYAYRFVPIKSVSTNIWSIGRIDVDALYNNLMNVFRYGNVSDPRVYVDSFIQYNFNAAQIHTAFARLAMGLAERGENDKAIEVLDYCMEQIPVTPGGFRWSARHVSIIEAYYAAGATEKGDAMLAEYGRITEEYVRYFSRFPEKKYPMVANTATDKLAVANELLSIAEQHGRAELSEQLAKNYLEYGLDLYDLDLYSLRYFYRFIPYLRLCYDDGETRGDDMVLAYADIFQGEIAYLMQVAGSRIAEYEDFIMDNVITLSLLADIAAKAGRDQVAGSINDFIRMTTTTLNRLVPQELPGQPVS